MKTKRVPLVVTEEHIRYARRGSVFNCPVARAIRNQLGIKAAVTHRYINWKASNKPEDTTKNSDELQAAIALFDQERVFNPATYMVEIPEELASK